MPIKNPEHARQYRSTPYLQAREQVRRRAQGRCERCGVEEHAKGAWDGNTFIRVPILNSGAKIITILLQTAHLDQNAHLGEHDPSRMLALCQRCHNHYDMDQRRENAARTRARKRVCPGQMVLDLSA